MVNPSSLSLWFPIKLAPGLSIVTSQEPVAVEIHGREIEFRVRGRLVIFVARGFTDREEAEAWFSKVRSGCYWAMLEVGTAFTAEPAIEDALMLDDRVPGPATRLGKVFPDGIDGSAYEDRPSVFPDGASLAMFNMGQAEVVRGISGDKFLAAVNFGAALVRDTPLEQRLETSLALCAAAAHEVSLPARFLTYIMALEALLEPRAKHDTAVQLVERWALELGHHIRTASGDELDSLRSLQGQMSHLREQSIKAGIRDLVSIAFGHSGAPDPAKEGVIASGLYDLRSELVHEGRLPAKTLSRACEDAKRLIHAVLKSALQYGLH